MKGIRERKLQENLKRISDRVKLKKSKKKLENGKNQEEEKEGDLQMSKNSQEESAPEAEVGDKHFVYENDNWG